jgi:hypothetical protein
MTNAGNSIRNSIIKRREAIEKFQARKREFLIMREQITNDIEEARTIWKTTLEQIPKQPFDQ